MNIKKVFLFLVLLSLLFLSFGCGKKYTVKFDSNGGTPIESQKVEKGSNIKKPSDPERLGYVFEGWFTESNTEWVFDEYVVSKDMTLYAKWSIITYNITYTLNGGINSSNNPTTYTVEDEIILEAPSEKTGYTGSWTNNGKIEKGSIGNKSFEALYTPNQYKITYDLNGGNALDSNEQSITYDSTYTISTPTRDGYTFLGWYNGSTKVNSGTWKYTSDIILTAKWFKGEMVVETIDGFTYIYYGKYPQTVVSDTSLISNLNNLTTTNSNGYYEYNGNEYAKVTAKPNSSCTFSNGTKVVNGSTYWFKVEPIKWRVLLTGDGELMVMSEYLLDAKQFYNSTSNRTIDGKTIEPNNYEYSDIRSWLNNEFYNKSFTTLEQSNIITKLVDNSLSSTCDSSNSYICNNTFDKVWLLSYSDATNISYGFITNSNRRAKVTDYAIANGINYSTDSSYLRNGYWWLRSPYSDHSIYARDVNFDGSIYSIYPDYVGDTSGGVRPALSLTIE